MKQQNPLKKKKLTKLERRRAGHGRKTMTTECTSINAVNYSTKQAEYLRTPDGARANAVVLI